MNCSSTCPTAAVFTNTPTKEKEKRQTCRYPMQISDETLQFAVTEHFTGKCSIPR
uniref:Uncharacterized protein n=1 Tax=Anguilla anguilla TaxID=7936 RepID=A0A0E9WBG5_ANGAN